MKIDPVTSINDLRAMLAQADLPTAEVDAFSYTSFFSATEDNCITGIVGIEEYGSAGLLRSLAVLPKAHGRGISRSLVFFIETYAKNNGISYLYLLTTTAESYFARLGYDREIRSNAPKEIKSTKQFSVVCPSSAAFLMKKLV